MRIWGDINIQSVMLQCVFVFVHTWIGPFTAPKEVTKCRDRCGGNRNNQRVWKIEVCCVCLFLYCEDRNKIWNQQCHILAGPPYSKGYFWGKRLKFTGKTMDWGQVGARVRHIVVRVYERKWKMNRNQWKSSQRPRGKCVCVSKHYL